MSNKSSGSKAERREAARAAAAARREEQLRIDRRNRFLLLGGIALAAIAVVVAIVLAVVNRPDTNASLEDVTRPSNTQADGGVAFSGSTKAGTGKAQAKTIDVYFDYSCGACAQFEAAKEAELRELIEGGEVNVVLHPVNILGQSYTVTAGNAFAEVVDQHPDKAWDFHTKLSANFLQAAQTQDTSNLNLAGVQKIAAEVGVPQATIDKFADNRFAGYLTATSNQFSKRSADRELSEDGGARTPTVTLAGKLADLSLIFQEGALKNWAATGDVGYVYSEDGQTVVPKDPSQQPTPAATN
ncbi:DsbA family protein [Buchananella hordeovulneris]|uniref:Thioredoxin-like fold domain-containing protein n=1 Tax=Buchananella hordeovulneris TaxID=52770 RepID=A0A1Q5PUZ7_9ACTO|nr:DsbA family protein [Buchananella hordeovulneris]OKL51423.1 hypothetical protein BSZ40_07600 [Buchananella hordeovulneris]RRD44317.1 hypothetical protein EII13_04255 [Buchananella hordeovulneris]